MSNPFETIHFVNGVATNVNLPVGTYEFHSSTIRGYADGKTETFTITPDTTSLTIYISGNGHLKVHVHDRYGSNVTSGEMVLTSADGTAGYGAPVPIINGYAVFNHLPYDATSGVNVYLGQTKSDYQHQPMIGGQPETLELKWDTADVVNARRTAALDIALQDSYYKDMIPLTGDLNVSIT